MSKPQPFNDTLSAKEAICAEPEVTDPQSMESVPEALKNEDKPQSIAQEFNHDAEKDGRLISKSIKSLCKNIPEESFDKDQKDALEELGACLGELVSEFNGFGKFRVAFLVGVCAIPLLPSAYKLLSGFLSGNKKKKITEQKQQAEEMGLKYHAQ
jgi:hypothetical protein